MSNLQANRPSRVKREWLLMGLPAALGGVLSLGLLGAAVWPTWQRLQLAEAEMAQLGEQRQRLPLLRTQLVKLRDNVDQAEQRSSQILGLIAGSGEITTFMAQLSAEAQRTGVSLDGYEPIITAPPAAEASKRSNAKPSKDKAPAPPPDPLLAPGLQKTSLLLTARGTGPQLLAFLRGLEKLSLLVVQSDLGFKHENTDAPKPGEAAANSTQLRLNLSLYSSAEQPEKAP
jgi:type IV pilus assembly protein PilO